MNGLIYFGAFDGSVYAPEQKSGRLKWRRPAGSSIPRSVVATPEPVHFTAFRSNLPDPAGALIALAAQKKLFRLRGGRA